MGFLDSSLTDHPPNQGIGWELTGVATGIAFFAAGGIAFLGVAITHVWLAAILGGAAVIDGGTGRIPNGLVALGALGGIGLLLVDGAGLGAAIGSGLGTALVLWSLRAASGRFTGRPGFGMGDVKLAGVLGLCLGWTALWALYLAVVCGALGGSIGLATGHVQRTSRLPFAPFMAIGAGLHTLLPLPLLGLPGLSG